jgi:hypothetical protein
MAPHQPASRIKRRLVPSLAHFPAEKNGIFSLFGVLADGPAPGPPVPDQETKLRQSADAKTEGMLPALMSSRLIAA